MTDIRSDEYWSTLFDITQDDLKRIAERMERDGAPQDLKAIALRLIRGRLEHGHDISPAALVKLTGNPSVRLWDPVGQWQINDVVLVARHAGKDRNGQPTFSAHLGEIQKIKGDVVTINVDGIGPVKYGIITSDNPSVVSIRETVREAVERKLQSKDIEQQGEGILLKHGERILNRLSETIQSDSRFAGLEGKWYVSKKLPELNGEILTAAYRKALENPGVGIEELLPGNDDAVLLYRMALHGHLQNAPQKFENIGTLARPQWRARLPEPDQAKVTLYAYDPQTFEILCRPGQKLSQKKAQRLQEFGLYAHVVTFAE